jgi:hypothetical protein
MEIIIAELEKHRKVTGVSKIVVLFDTAGVTLRKITHYQGKHVFHTKLCLNRVGLKKPCFFLTVFSTFWFFWL